ncbi:MAG: PP0621 family protein [Rhodocyclales bacterium]|nr:PP0621 family protein [Rhodocyclales bacterium]
MAKFLLFIVVLAVIYAVVRASNRRSKPPPAARLPDAMTQCAHCGLHFPHAESVSDGERDYCCEEHRRMGVRS